jgi:hypothetical protein
MAVRVKVAEYYYASIESKPGEGQRLFGHCSSHGVNLTNLTAFPSGQGKAQIDFFTDDVARLKEAAKEAGIELVGPKKAFLVQGDDRPGLLADFHLRLAYAGVNVYAANGTSDGSGRFGYVIWVKPEDFENAARALGLE